MKTMLILTAAILGLTGSPAWGDATSGQTAVAPAKVKNFSGVATAVNQQNNTVAVKGLWITKTFNVAANCKVSLQDKSEASLADLHPGQKLNLEYQNADGVLVAQRIAQQNMVYSGYIAALDTKNRTCVVKHGFFTRRFSIPENCAVLLRDDKSGSLDDLKPGNTVKIIYESNHGGLAAQRIEQPDATFAGTIRAIDTDARTVKAKSFLSEKKFNLADGCRIVVAGNPDGHLRDLKIGDKAVFSYENVNGVLVTRRIGCAAEMPDTKTAEASQREAAPLVGQTSQ